MAFGTIARAAAILTATASIAGAENLRDCDSFEANARNLSQPYEDAIRTYANGKIALMSLWLEEPACCGAHLLITYPEPGENWQTCRLLSNDGQLGYSNIELHNAEASYDPAEGLTIEMPASTWDGVQNHRFWLAITINQANGQIWIARR